MISTTYALIIAGVVGAILGLAASLAFNIYGKKSATPYIYSLFGVSSEEWIATMILSIVAAGVVGLAGISFLIRDVKYPSAKPFEFTLETLLFAFLPASVFLLMGVFRGYPPTKDTYLEFFLLAAKFGLLHVLLQFSGFYSNVFPPK
jgi:ABC-type dipeptide/oligopeptide/nickel transport system permease component